MKKSFGNNLKLAREGVGLSQQQLAALLGTTQQRISEWETDKVEPTLFSIIRLIKALNITFEELTEDIEIIFARN